MDMNTKLLEVAYIHNLSPQWYSFMDDAMFSDVDYVCEQYDFTDETPESELNFTTRGEINNSYVRKITFGNTYIVVVFVYPDIVIYKVVDAVNGEE